jgi:hypothetical protein
MHMDSLEEPVGCMFFHVHVQGHCDSVIVSMLDYLISTEENIITMYRIWNFHYNVFSNFHLETGVDDVEA